jgi:hypothetical protein
MSCQALMNTSGRAAAIILRADWRLRDTTHESQAEHPAICALVVQMIEPALLAGLVSETIRPHRGDER